MSHTYSPNYPGGLGGRIIGAQEFEAAVGYDFAITFQPGQQSEAPSQKKKKKLDFYVQLFNVCSDFLKYSIGPNKIHLLQAKCGS